MNYSLYDPVGNVLASSQSTSGTPSAAFTYTWNMLGGLSSETYPSGRTVSYGYDGGGRVNLVSGALPYAASKNYAGSITNPITYAAHHALASLLLGNGVTESVTWNDRLQETVMQAGNLLTLKFYPCDGGAVACTNNNGNIWR